MTPIDVLPDDVLLVIFDFYVVRMSRRKKDTEVWQSLVHVCRRWRCLVFGSPRHLDLQLFCTPKTPIRDTLDVWPVLPLIVSDNTVRSSNMDNIIAALGQSNRVCDVFFLHLMGWQLEQVVAAMQVPFPELTDLRLWSGVETPPIIPDSFLGGSAPRLRCFSLNGIPFPGFPKLHLSATHLADLALSGIPDSGYISPEAMATCLSVLTSLDTLSLGFGFFFSRSRSRPPMTHSILPDLTDFQFEGASEYLDDLVARIDAPRLDKLSITFFPQMNYDSPHLVQFISRTPRFEGPNEAHVRLDTDAEVQLIWTSDGYDNIARIYVEISCEIPNPPQPSSIAQLYTMCLPPLPTVEILRLGDFSEPPFLGLAWKDDIDQWLELLRPFTAVKILCISEEYQPTIASALQELVGGRTTEVLPSLQNIFLDRFEPPFQEALGQFVAARQLSNHPVAVSPLYRTL